MRFEDGPRGAQKEISASPLFFMLQNLAACYFLKFYCHHRRAPELGKDMVPKRLFLTKGVGKHKERLTSFELALRDAGIAAQNLVRVSSIFPARKA
jgi:hypothetical protein